MNEERVLSYLPYAYALAHRRSSFAEFDDIVQEAMLSVVQIAIRSAALLETDVYVRTVMIHAADGHVRGNFLIRKPFLVLRGREKDTLKISYLSPLQEEFLEEVKPLPQEEYSWLYALIERLSEVQRRVIGHHYGLEGYGTLSFGEIAKMTGCKRQSVTGAQRRALQNLRTWIEARTAFVRVLWALMQKQEVRGEY